MRKLLCCVLMMTLLLTACGGGAGSEAEELAVQIRGACLSAQTCSGTAQVTADYGQRICRYTMEFTADEQETALTLTAPETVAGITARLSGEKGSLLEYDGAVLETGPLNEDGLTPVSAIPALLGAARTGYLDVCALEETQQGRLLHLTIRDPQIQAGTGVETQLWFDADSMQLRRGEISQDGFCVIQCEFSTFLMETD